MRTALACSRAYEGLDCILVPPQTTISSATDLASPVRVSISSRAATWFLNSVFLVSKLLLKSKSVLAARNHCIKWSLNGDVGTPYSAGILNEDISIK